MIQAVIVIALVSALSVKTYAVFDAQAQQEKAKSAAKQAVEYGDALQQYMRTNYSTLAFLEKTTITPQLLRDAGLLKSWFPDKNAYGEPYTADVIAKPTPSGKVLLEAVTGIGSSKISQDMNRYLALATGKAMAGQTINGKMYGNNSTYEMAATKDLSSSGNVQLVVRSLGSAMQDIKLAPAIASETNITPIAMGAVIMPTVPAPVYPANCPGGVCVSGGGYAGGSGGGGAAPIVNANDLILALYNATYSDAHNADPALFAQYGANALSVLQSNGAVTVNANGTVTINDAGLVATTAAGAAWSDGTQQAMLYGQAGLDYNFNQNLLATANNGVVGGLSRTASYFDSIVGNLPVSGAGNNTDATVINNSQATQQQATTAAIAQINTLIGLYNGTSDPARQELIAQTANETAAQAVAFYGGSSSVTANGAQVTGSTGIGGTSITYTDAVAWAAANPGATAAQARDAAVSAGMDANSAAALVSVMQSTGAL